MSVAESASSSSEPSLSVSAILDSPGLTDTGPDVGDAVRPADAALHAERGNDTGMLPGENMA